jgi:phage repressor protein C with HTH and peptisase S24 domain
MYEDGSRNPKYEKIVLLSQILELNDSANVPHDKDPDFVAKLDDGTILIGQIKTAAQKSIRKPKIDSQPYMAPFISVKAQAGYTKAFDSVVFLDEQEKYALPPGISHLGANWAYWEIDGDSMEPTFHNKDIILTSMVHPMDWENIRPWYVHVIVTDTKVLIKRVVAKTPFEWALISDNEENYPQQLLPIEYIKQVWVFRRHIDSKVPPPKMFVLKV